MRLLSKGNLKLNGLYAGVLLVTVLCSPLGWALTRTIQIAPLPLFFHWPVAVARTSIIIGFLPWLLMLFIAPFFAAFFFFKKNHRFALLASTSCLIAWGSFPLAQKVDHFWNWRRIGLQRMAKDARPLIQAIDSHCNQEGKCPQYLEDLVPKYIAEIPPTGAVGYPHFKYQAPGDRTSSSSYELLVETPSGGINWDKFVYWPDGKYPKEMYSGLTERIGDWAYVHE